MAVLVGMFMLSQSLFVEKGVAVKESGRKFVVKNYGGAGLTGVHLAV